MKKWYQGVAVATAIGLVALGGYKLAISADGGGWLIFWGLVVLSIFYERE